jgi:hypothetical protein
LVKGCSQSLGRVHGLLLATALCRGKGGSSQVRTQKPEPRTQTCSECKEASTGGGKMGLTCVNAEEEYLVLGYYYPKMFIIVHNTSTSARLTCENANLDFLEGKKENPNYNTSAPFCTILHHSLGYFQLTKRIPISPSPPTTECLNLTSKMQ